LKFKAILLVRSFTIPVARQPLDLVINPDPSFPEVDLASDDVLFNSVTSMTQLCSDGDGMPWRGAKEKSEALIHLFVQGLSPSNGIIADMTASTGLCTSSLFLNFLPFCYL
jgi:hypothetical protein